MTTDHRHVARGRPDVPADVDRSGRERCRPGEGTRGSAEVEFGDGDGTPGLERTVAGETHGHRADAVEPRGAMTQRIRRSAVEDVRQQLAVAAPVPTLADGNRHLARRMKALIQGTTPDHNVVFQPRLEVRRSTAAPPA